MKNLKFLFGIHNHQPLGNFDHVFEELYGQCYQPYFEVLQEFPKLKTTPPPFQRMPFGMAEGASA